MVYGYKSLNDDINTAKMVMEAYAFVCGLGIIGMMFL